MELKERDVRVLIRSLQWWGDLQQRCDVIVCFSSMPFELLAQILTFVQVTKAKLQDKNRGMMFDVAEEIIEICEQAVKESEEQKRLRIASGETVTDAQKSKAVLVTCRGVDNINAETVLPRHRDLRILYNILSKLDDPYKWSTPIDNIRPTLNWSGRWVRRTTLLLVGAYLYGLVIGRPWPRIPSLDSTASFSLKKARKGKTPRAGPIPNAIHLVRRDDFLLSILREHDEKLRLHESSLRHKAS